MTDHPAGDPPARPATATGVGDPPSLAAIDGAGVPAGLLAELAGLDELTRRRRVHEVIRTLGGATVAVQQEYRDAIVGAGYLGARDWVQALAEAKRTTHEAKRLRAVRGGDEPPDRGDRIPIRIGGEAATIRVLAEQLGHGDLLPDVYVTNGALVHLTRVSGDTDTTSTGDANTSRTGGGSEDGSTNPGANSRANANATVGTNSNATGPPVAGGDGPPLPVLADPLTVASLARLLAHHAYVHRYRRDGDGIAQEAEVTPSPRALAAVLSTRFWPEVRPLYGIVGAPVLRPDGSLLQQPGYDRATGLYLAPKVPVAEVPDQPDAAAVAAARAFVLDRLLGDFPFVDPADRANYVGLLVAQILRPYLRGLTPFGLVSATTQSSGKTLLTEVIGQLYGYKRLVWRRGDDAELEKTITTALRSPAATLIWDNLAEGSTVGSPVLAQLLTSPIWSARILGTNSSFDAANDRLWLANGNNVRLGGDMATRTVLVRLDPNDPHPEFRDQTRFGIPHLDQWLKPASNRATLLRHLLVLVMDWMATGAPRSPHTMRQFTGWAAATGGLLAHHGLAGFLDNVDQVHAADEDNAEWVAFLARWHELYAGQRKPARDIRRSADIDTDPTGRPIDRWQGTFLTDDQGRIPSGKSLGRYLTGHTGRWHGPYVLRSEISSNTNSRVYWVEAKDG